MATWTNEELDRIGNAEELQLTPLRDDRGLRPYVTMWVVRAGDDVYVRSADGPGRPWYRRAKACGAGRIRAGGVELDVTFAEATADAQASIDAAYHAKYDRYGSPRWDAVRAWVERSAKPSTLSPTSVTGLSRSPDDDSHHSRLPS